MNQNGIDFSRLQRIHDKARLALVSWSLHYDECDSSFYFSIRSTAPSEEWTGKGTLFILAVEETCEWLDHITKEVEG